jgi:hypothetical protein
MSLLVVGEAEAVHAGALRGGLVGEDCLEGPREERARLPTHHTSDPWVHAPRMRCVRREASFQSPQNSIIETRVGCEARWPRPRHMSEAMMCRAGGIPLRAGRLPNQRRHFDTDEAEEGNRRNRKLIL